ncbi:MAG: class I SAM-dependent methyltransferase [Thermoanaerobaculales bacterium]|nr:class I SAM-dependent methyltransferase [Thermoanaerobaculales bacterium]
MIDPGKLRFFDAAAARWDASQDLPRLHSRLTAGLAELGLGGDESVLDLGCGTGNLTRALLGALAARGRVIAVDFSQPMLGTAARKVGREPRVVWCQAEAAELPLADAVVDRAVCFSAWPHFDDPYGVAHELARVLRPGGSVHVWHLASRAHINHIHATAGEAVSADLLRPAAETAGVLESCGLAVCAAIDDDTRYLVTAVKGASRA